MSQRYSTINGALESLETIMRRDGLWHHKPPSIEAMNSTMPFAVDTMEFTDWLQFIFIPRMRLIIQQDEQLPSVCDIAPAAEVALMGRSGITDLILQLQRIDKIFAGVPSI